MAQSNRIKRQRVDEVLGLVGLEEAAGRRIGPFSLGMKQRLGIAAALLGGPEILLFDEPVTGLDPEGIVWIRTFFRSLAAEGRTVFVSSHLMSEMALTAHHLIVIGHGRLIADAAIDDILAHGSRWVRGPVAARRRVVGVGVQPRGDGQNCRQPAGGHRHGCRVDRRAGGDARHCAA